MDGLLIKKLPLISKVESILLIRFVAELKSSKSITPKLTSGLLGTVTETTYFKGGNHNVYSPVLELVNTVSFRQPDPN